MDRELIINGKKIVLSDVTRIGITIQANDIGQLQKRNGTFTNTFKIPLCDENLAAFEWANLPTSSTVIPYRRNLATYKEGGLEIVSDGEAILKESEDNKYLYLDVVSGNVDLARSIGELIVGDLYTGEVHVWSLENAVNSRDGSEYYIYPFIDWRTDIDTFFSSTTVNVKQMIPAATMPGLFQRLEAYTGYTFTGAYLDSEDHINMILTPSDFENNLTDESAHPKAIRNGSFQYLTVEAPVNSGLNNDFAEIVYDTYQNNMILFNDMLYFPAANEVANLRFAGSTKWSYRHDTSSGIIVDDIEYFYYRVQIKDTNGTVLAEKTSDIWEYDAVYDSDLVLQDGGVWDISTGDINLSAGVGYYTLILGYVHGRQSVDTDVQFQIQKKTYFQKLPRKAIVYGNDIKFKDIYRMKVKDVLDDILRLRGILIQTNSYRKEVQFNYFSDLIANMPRARNWSAKVDIRTIRLGYRFGTYGQKNNCIFSPNDQVTPGLGDYYFTVDDQTLEAEIDIIKLNHSATEEDNRYLGQNVPKIEGIDSLNKWNNPGYRILQIDRQNTSYTVTYTDDTITDNATTNIPFCNFVGFAELIPEYYQILIDILNKVKAIRLGVNLSPVDVQNFDFTIPVYLNIPQLDLSAYFYVNEISNYKEGLTTVELIRL